MCFTLAGFLIVFGGWFIYQGFDKLNYDNSSFEPKNVYVGGDAYNYIINSNYFTGYGVLGCSAFICATMLVCIGLYLCFKDKDMTLHKGSLNVVNQDKDISEELPLL